MSYQNVSKPRFYIDWNTYYNAIGIYTDAVPYRSNTDGKGSYQGMGMLNPSNQRYISPQDNAVGANCSIRYNSDKWILDPEQVNWGGVLAHNLATVDTAFSFQLGVDVDDVELDYPYFNGLNDIVNSRFSGVDNKIIKPEYDGFSLFEINGYSIDPLTIKKNHLVFHPIRDEHVGQEFKFGAWCVGNYYDMHSPDLSLKLSYEYDGVNTIKTAGGATLTNALYTKPADWGNGGCWQLGSDADGNPIDNLRSGRRVWDLSFSYISDSNLMPMVAANSTIEADVNDTTLLNGSDFFSQVWNRTLGHLPFIFQADSSNNSPDQFAICRFDMDSLEYDQVALNVYNVKLKIKESW